ncbi:hypothetical protein V2J09_009433 [Rumex salicifolius]
MLISIPFSIFIRMGKISPFLFSLFLFLWFFVPVKATPTSPPQFTVDKVGVPASKGYVNFDAFLPSDDCCKITSSSSIGQSRRCEREDICRTTC